ncbi:Uncharacterised protein [Legionella busanensis]|uniref:Uncharacterized protein n=1 Tax=Legionella busanensis TaxID=190655 RepID=A0A378JIY5_9GAMM|nr:hypothetical protein [Legionella busanensis]STX51027.1 Uncharacterised protein [Legionella busanensis]
MLSKSETTATRSSKANFDATQILRVQFAQYDPYGYIILNSKGRVLAAYELENPRNKTKIPFLAKDNDEKGLYAYIVFDGIQLKEGKKEPVQVILMRRMYMMSNESQHPRLLEAADIMFKIGDIVSEIYNITLKRNSQKNLFYYFSGECFFTKFIKSMSSLENKQLDGLKFNTRGTETSTKFINKPKPPKLIGCIPLCCWDFHKGFDDMLRHTISSPERREFIRKILGQITYNSPIAFFKKSENKKINIVEIELTKESDPNNNTTDKMNVG